MRALVDAHILLPALVCLPHAIRQADPPRYDRTLGHRASHAQPDTTHPAPASTTGYPLILEGFPLSGSGSWIGIILFNWSMRVPFLWEARAFVDWTVETTSLDIWSWMKLEDIYAGLQASAILGAILSQLCALFLTPRPLSGCSSRGT